LAADWVYRWKQTFHYERIFGYEVYKGESQMHPNMLGLNPNADKPVGWVKGGMLKNYISPKDGLSEEQRRVWSISFPWKTPGDKDFFSKRREAIKKYKNRYHYTEYDEYFNPEIKAKVSQSKITPDYFLGSYQLPRWSDLRNVLFHNQTCGRTTMGTYPKRAAHYMLDNLLADNSIHSWITGGYEIISPFYRIPGVDSTTLMLYTQLKRSTRFSTPTLNKVKGEDALPDTSGSGISFLALLGLDNPDHVSYDIGEIDISDKDYESEGDILFDIEEGDDLDIDLPSEDGCSAAGDFDAENYGNVA